MVRKSRLLKEIHSRQISTVSKAEHLEIPQQPRERGEGAKVKRKERGREGKLKMGGGGREQTKNLNKHHEA